ncbi:recombinase family protein [Nocardia fusca]|uniref:recombinase family protein n=1 Tax=Nocardia fusca TaxID=941183 RepID=UPI0037C6C699
MRRCRPPRYRGRRTAPDRGQCLRRDPPAVGTVDLRRRGIGFRSLHEALDTTTPGGRLVFHVFAALAEFIRELIVDGTHEGLTAARARGQRLGRPPAMSDEQVRQARALLTRPDESVSSIARLLGVSRTTLYKYLPEVGAKS